MTAEVAGLPDPQLRQACDAVLDRLASRPIGTKGRARLQGASWLEEGFLRVNRDRAARVTTHTVLTQRTWRTHGDGEMKVPVAIEKSPLMANKSPR